MCSESVRDVIVEMQVARRRQQLETVELQRKITLFSSKVSILTLFSYTSIEMIIY